MKELKFSLFPVEIIQLRVCEPFYPGLVFGRFLYSSEEAL